MDKRNFLESGAELTWLVADVGNTISVTADFGDMQVTFSVDGVTAADRDAAVDSCKQALRQWYLERGRGIQVKIKKAA